MDTAILRSRILDMAIHGQLVPQDPNEGTAMDLLKEIAHQRGKAISPITDNVPFTIPENWRWVKLGDMLRKMKSRRPDGETFLYVDIDAIDNKSCKIRCPKIIKTSEAPSRASRYTQRGDVLFSMVRPYLRNIALVDGDNYIASTGFYVCSPIITNNIYLYYFMTSTYLVDGLNFFMRGDNSPSINGNQLEDFLFPLPPLVEQSRIVAKVEELLSEVETIEQAQADITQAATILRSRVLDMAISGKLTNSNIEEWTWDTITNVTDPISSRDSQIKTSEILPSGKYAVVSQGQKLIDGYCDDESRVITTLPVILFGDHTRNVKFIDFPFVVGADGTKLHKCRSIDPKFCYYWILWAADNMTNRGYERHYSLLKQTPLHLPPLPEQRRIVAKIEELFAEIDKLK